MLGTTTAVTTIDADSDPSAEVEDTVVNDNDAVEAIAMATSLPGLRT